MTVVLKGMDLSPTAEWWGWEIVGRSAKGYVDPDARADFFAEIASAAAAADVLTLHASGRSKAVHGGLIAYDDTSGVAVAPRFADSQGRYSGGEVRFAYEDDDPRMTWAIGCCALVGLVELPETWGTVKYFNANDAGGDDIEWAGILGNQGGDPGDGANGTSWYYFKSASPNAFQTPWAASAGLIYRISGYCANDNAGTLVLNFLDAAPGSSAGSAGSHVIEAQLVATVPADLWTAFSGGPFTAPVGTTSIALSRTGSISFDEVLIEVQT